MILPSLFAMLHFYPRFVKTNTQSTPLYNSVRCLCKKKFKKEKTGLEVSRTKITFHSLLSIPMRSRPSIAGAALGRSAGAAPAAGQRGRRRGWAAWRGPSRRGQASAGRRGSRARAARAAGRPRDYWATEERPGGASGRRGRRGSRATRRGGWATRGWAGWPGRCLGFPWVAA